MIEITYLDASKNERTVTFESYDDFDRSQQACLIGVADYYPVQKLTESTTGSVKMNSLELVCL